MNVNGPFNNIPIEVLSKILTEVNDMESLNNSETVCKLWNQTINKIENYETKKEEFFVNKLMPEIDTYPPGLIDALGGKKKVYLLPILELTKEDDYGYIDWLQPEDVSGHAIWRGKDKYQRPFVTFSFKQFGIFPFLLGNGVKTYHKRFTDPANTYWFGAGNKTIDFEYPCTEKMDMHPVFSRLKELFSTGIEFDKNRNRITFLGASSLLPLEYDVLQIIR